MLEDICDKCNGTGRIEHTCRPKLFKRLKYLSAGNTSHCIKRCECGKYYYYWKQIDEGAGSSEGIEEITQADVDEWLDIERK